MNSDGGSLLHFGVFEADLATGELRRNGRPVKLQPQPFKVLALLLERQGELVTREEIRQRLWGGDTFVDFEQGLNFTIKKIREALGDDADRPRYIETLPRRGYRFIASVELHGAPWEASQQPATVPESRVTSIAEKLRPSQKATRVESAGASGTAILAAVEAASRSLDDEQYGQEPVLSGAKGARATVRRGWVLALVAVVVLAAAAGSYFYIHSRSGLKLTDKDTIVLADFTNTTGDPVFDGTLRQGLSAQLEQSPFLNLLSDDRITQTLALMTQPKGARLTHALAREVCQRTASTASIEGSIASLGSQYVLGLEAVNCRNGDLLADEQETANGRERVIKALGEVATKMRRKLGESLASVEKYDTPPESVTTASLEALQAYSLGYRAQLAKNDPAAAIPFFQRAISLDPNFAMGYARLGTNHVILGETARAAENTREAYELRERASEREKFYIESHYDTFVTGDLEVARKICELWAQTYPRDVNPPTNLGFIYQTLGEYGKALAAGQDALKLDPGSGVNYSNLVAAYVLLNHLDEAKATTQEAQAHKVVTPLFHYFLYLVDFLQHDRAAMELEAAALMGKPGYEDLMLYFESDTAAYAGQFVKARDLIGRAVESAERADEKETAAGYEAEAALREVLAGNPGPARWQVQAALALSEGRDVEAMSAVALGLAGDSAHAMRLGNDLDKRFPKDTIVQFEYLPMMRAATILGSGNASKHTDKALEALITAAPYELGSPAQAVSFSLYPVYLRGEAYLAAHQGAAAAAEFHRIIDHPGVAQNEPISALAHLGLGRAYAIEAGLSRHDENSGVKPPVQPEAFAKARMAYQDFLALWKDGDPDIPILKQAKAEYVRLQ